MAEIGILTVCTGNVCRSPLMERLLQRTLDQRYGRGVVPVRSAGTRALVGSPMDERAAEVLRGLGGDPDGFVARRLVEPMVSSAALVLTATREHRAQVSRMHPRAMRRTFTFRELAHLLDSVGDEEELPDGEDPQALLARLAEIGTAHRGLHRPARQEDLDVADPYRRGDEVYALMREQVVTAYPALARVLGGR
ncbi:arsenate reductase/protein-tyrosine-phosphatase family protein [Ornithinimicrobium avium]|uniref:Low molecular weight phosphatase family protein n=1 Tax=Ornithinimicrobium avium TaxID=2283195 RepID=A0A345NQP6_9MICO|nr:low molecular weight phosphatase family protein [Ornithinimicrobium avium]AXH97354.1 low molecular weight phosphatase family protein [Ornithinimicrobium avium]